MIVADTSVLVGILRSDRDALRFVEAQDDVVASTLTAWELWAGAARPRELVAVRDLLGQCTLEAFSARHAEAAGALQRDCVARGERRPALDLLIASHALVRACRLATLDADHLDIPGVDVVRIGRGAKA